MLDSYRRSPQERLVQEDSADGQPINLQINRMQHDVRGTTDPTVHSIGGPMPQTMGKVSTGGGEASMRARNRLVSHGAGLLSSDDEFGNLDEGYDQPPTPD